MKIVPALLFGIGTLLSQEAFAEVYNKCPVKTDWVETGSDGAAYIVSGFIGERQISILIDSGVPETLIDSSLSSAVSDVDGQVDTGTAYGGDINIKQAKNLNLQFSGRKLHIARVGLADLSAINIYSPAISLIIGRDMLEYCSMHIDSDHSRFRISESGEDALASSRQVRVAIDYEDGIPKVPVNLGDNRRFFALLDTGSQGGLVLDAGTWRLVKPQSTRQTSAVSAGLGGLVVEGLAIIQVVSIGTFDFHDVDVRIEPANAGNDKPMVGTGVIGTELLNKANVIIDFDKKTLLLGERATKSPVSPKSTSGLISRHDGNKLRILHIMENGPAAEAGITTQDEICGIDDQSISQSYSTSPIRSWSRDVPGRTVRLTLCDGRDKQITLREFY